RGRGGRLPVRHRQRALAVLPPLRRARLRPRRHSRGRRQVLLGAPELPRRHTGRSARRDAGALRHRPRQRLVARARARRGARGARTEGGTTMLDPKTVIDFWRDAGPAKWFARDDAFDARFRDGFAEAHWAAARRELEHWMDT